MSVWRQDFGVDVASSILTLIQRFVKICQLIDIVVEWLQHGKVKHGICAKSRVESVV